jgi:hypothetical protein
MGKKLKEELEKSIEFLKVDFVENLVKSKSHREIVLYPIEVLRGQYCMMHLDPFLVCTHLDTQNGVPTCTLKLDQNGPLEETEQGIEKPEKCLKLINKNDVFTG